MTVLPDDVEMTELVDADFPRVDLVGKGANGIPRFLIAKQDSDSAGLLDPGYVRDLIAKTEPEPSGRERVTMPSGVTLTGSPSDIAAFIHKASQRAEERKETDVADPVAKDGEGPELDTGVDGMDPTVPLAEPDEMGAGDPTDPGSPAWESIDAATARKWSSILARSINALSVLAEREMLEAASADPDDAENAWNLEDACCAIDYAISLLAPFAVAEQSEADCGDDMLAAIGKSAATGPDVLAAIAKAVEAEGVAEALATVEGFAAVAKAGRVLSAANEARIREASASLSTVLSSLPQAPTTDDGQAVAKQEEKAVDGTGTPAGTQAEQVAKTATPEERAAATGPANAGGTTTMGVPQGGAVEALPGDLPGREVTKAALQVAVYDHRRRLAGLIDPAQITQVAKADGDEKPPMQAVFNQDGDLIGIVDPAAITPVSGAGAAPAADADDAAPDPADMTPAPAGETGTPAAAVSPDGTVAKSSDDKVFAVLKSIVSEAVAEVIGERAPAEDIAKQADVAGLREQVETLKSRLETVEQNPAAPKVFTNGQTPRPDQMRGQDKGASPVIDVAKAREMKQRMYTADPAEANRIKDEMNRSAIATLEAIHSGARQ